KPARGVGQTAVEVVTEAYRGEGWLDAVGLALPFAKGKAKTGLDQFLTVAGQLGRRLEGGEALGTLIHGILELTGLGGYHREQDEIQNSTKLQNLDELVSAASPF